MSAHVVVVGGGLHGCSAAIHLARRGYGVTIFEKDYVGRHASGVNAGGLRRLRRHAAEIPLSIVAMEMWHRLDELLGQRLSGSCEFSGQVGQVSVAEDESDMQALVARAAEVRALGYDHEEVIDRAELRRVVPALAPSCIGGLISRRDGFATPYLTSKAFRLRALELGVSLREGVGVMALDRRGSGWRVHTAGGPVEADIVVNCAGAWGWQVAAMCGEILPKGYFGLSQMVTARMPHFVTPVVLGTGRSMSFHQTPDGTVLIGGGIEGSHDLEGNYADAVAGNLARTGQVVLDLFPVMRDATIIRSWAGLEARMPDVIPVIGRSAKDPALIHSFGFSAHGFQLVPVAGSIVAELVDEGSSRLPIEAFRASRFEEGRNDAETSAL
ncbi:MAG: NAD(P)/FAD-dependent oxidoreductase [Parvibaculaceae bacterium]